MAREIKTVFDTIEALNDALGNATAGIAMRGIRRSIQSALREISATATSPYMTQKGRIQLRAPQTDGHCTYDHTGGTYERMLSLDAASISAGYTWPSWAIDASVYFDGVISDVEAVKSSSVLTLDVNLNPGADVTTAADYVLFPRYYRLPDDFDDTQGFYGEDLVHIGREVTMEDYLKLNRWDCGVGTPKFYAIGGVQDLVGSMGVFPWPPSDADATLDFLYQRKPNEIRYTGTDASDYVGTVSADSTSTTLIGSTTAFNSKMVGSVILIGDATNVPTGLAGLYPYTDQRVIHGVSDTTHLVLDRAPSVTTGSAKYRITDYLDIDPVFYDAFFMRCCLDLAVQRNLEQAGTFRDMYREALHLAKMASSRGNQTQIAMEAPAILTRNIIQGTYDQLTEI